MSLHADAGESAGPRNLREMRDTLMDALRETGGATPQPEEPAVEKAERQEEAVEDGGSGERVEARAVDPEWLRGARLVLRGMGRMHWRDVTPVLDDAGRPIEGWVSVRQTVSDAWGRLRARAAALHARCEGGRPPEITGGVQEDGLDALHKLATYLDGVPLGAVPEVADLFDRLRTALASHPTGDQPGPVRDHAAMNVLRSLTDMEDAKVPSLKRLPNPWRGWAYNGVVAGDPTEAIIEGHRNPYRPEADAAASRIAKSPATDMERVLEEWEAVDEAVLAMDKALIDLHLPGPYEGRVRRACRDTDEAMRALRKAVVNLRRRLSKRPTQPEAPELRHRLTTSTTCPRCGTRMRNLARPDEPEDWVCVACNPEPTPSQPENGG